MPTTETTIWDYAVPPDCSYGVVTHWWATSPGSLLSLSLSLIFFLILCPPLFSYAAEVVCCEVWVLEVEWYVIGSDAFALR
jgi:hypothetical protein